MTSKPHRYLVLTQLFLPTKGGTTIWFSEVYRRLGGKDIHIVTADVPGAEAVDAAHPNTIHRTTLRRRPWLRPESLVIYLKLLVHSLALALTHRFDSIHAIRPLPEGFVGWLVARMSFRPFLLYVHGEELTTWGQGHKYRLMCFTMRHADRLIANSDYTRDVMVAMDVDPKRIELIYPGVDIERFRPDLAFQDLRQRIGVGPDGLLVLSVGRLQRRKGFDKVIGALSGLVQAGLDVHYALIGIGEDKEYLMDLAVQQGVVERVHLLGHVEENELPRWYNACDLFVMPNREIDGDTEGFGMVYLEAAACGKPCIAGIAGGTGSAVVDGVTGLRVDGEDGEQLFEALTELLRDEPRRVTLGTRGLERARKEFSWERVAEKTRQLEI